MPGKTFVLDTNVLLHDPKAYLHFEDNTVIIPLKVIEEIDQFKHEMTERGRSAREIARTLDKLRAKGRLSDGIRLEPKGRLKVMYHEDTDIYSPKLSADHLLLKLTQELSARTPGRCILVTKDVNLRLKADALGLRAEDYENGRVKYGDNFTGYVDLVLETEVLKAFAKEGSVDPDAFGVKLLANQYVMLQDRTDPRHTLLGRFDGVRQRIVGLIPTPDSMRPVSPRNREQHFALDALLNDSIKLVTLTGKAGSGKTLMAVAAGVHKTIEQGNYSKMLVSRPIFPMGRDVGYLPGTLDEKLDPWMKPIKDAIEFIQQGHGGARYRLENNPLLEVEALTYIRGRSIPNQFMIIDETQNLTPLEVKTVITRAGQGTKLVLTGDMFQIDNPYVDSLSNGLNVVTEAFRNQPIAAHIALQHGVRSDLAALASDLL